VTRDEANRSQRQANLLVGRRIDQIKLHPFDDMRGGIATDPTIQLDDGSVIQFVVQETETGEYGVKLEIVRQTNETTRKAKQKR